MKNPGSISEIELVLEDIREMKVISRFPNIKSLTLINNNIEKIEVSTYF